MATDKLREQVKRKLNITWTDTDTEARVTDIMENAAVVIRRKLGISAADFDFSAAGMENVLYCAYCLYEYNQIVNEFDDAYANDIMQCRAKYEVEQWGAADNADV